MGGNRGYDIFPRTFKARLLLGTAFAGGLVVAAGTIALYECTPFSTQTTS